MHINALAQREKLAIIRPVSAPDVDAFLLAMWLMHCVRFKTSTGELYEVDWRDVEFLQERDPEGRTVPGPDRNVLLLTADDCVFLWSQNISW